MDFLLNSGQGEMQESSDNTEVVNNLVAMGFNREEAINAL